MTGELAAAKLAAENRTEAMIARRTLNVIEVIDPSLPWFELVPKWYPKGCRLSTTKVTNQSNLVIISTASFRCSETELAAVECSFFHEARSGGIRPNSAILVKNGIAME
jgi:hypothetical protein